MASDGRVSNIRTGNRTDNSADQVSAGQEALTLWSTVNCELEHFRRSADAAGYPSSHKNLSLVDIGIERWWQRQRTSTRKTVRWIICFPASNFNKFTTVTNLVRNNWPPGDTLPFIEAKPSTCRR